MVDREVFYACWGAGVAGVREYRVTQLAGRRDATIRGVPNRRTALIVGAGIGGLSEDSQQRWHYVEPAGTFAFSNGPRIREHSATPSPLHRTR